MPAKPSAWRLVARCVSGGCRIAACTFSSSTAGANSSFICGLAAGETFDDGARRELREELGIDAPLEPLFPLRYADERTAVRGMVYRAMCDGPFVFQPEEVVRGEFVAIEAALKRAASEPFCPDGIEALRQWRGAEPEARRVSEGASYRGSAPPR